MRDGKADLRLDRRLARRRGWVAPNELEKELAALPDVAEKAEVIDLPGAPSGDEDESGASEPDEAPSFH